MTISDEIHADLNRIKEYLEKYPEDPSLGIYTVCRKEWIESLGLAELAWALSHPEEYGMPSRNDILGFVEIAKQRLEGKRNENIEDWSI